MAAGDKYPALFRSAEHFPDYYAGRGGEWQVHAVRLGMQRAVEIVSAMAQAEPRRQLLIVVVGAGDGIGVRDVALPPDPFGLLPPTVDASIGTLSTTAQTFLKGVVGSAPVSVFKKPRDAARDVVVGLVAPGLAGAYLSDGEPTETSPGAADDAAAAELWDWSRSTIDEALALIDEERARGDWDF